LLSGGLVALTVALALVASLLYAQPVIRAYWWIAARRSTSSRAYAPRRLAQDWRPQNLEAVALLIIDPLRRGNGFRGSDEQMFGAKEQDRHEGQSD
jgi:hypothetical protein